MPDDKEIIEPQTEEEIGEENDDEIGEEGSRPAVPDESVGGEEGGEAGEDKPEDSQEEGEKEEWVGKHSMKGSHPTVPPPPR